MHSHRAGVGLKYANPCLRYQALSAQLARVGLTAAGLDGDKHQAIRQQYRDGLDVFSKANAGSTTAHLRPSRRRMLTGVQDSPSDLDPINFDNLRIGPTPSLPLTLGPYVAQPPLFGTRYTQDFEELGILGKGGYGIVFQCRHKLDGVIYAVKKVPVSERRRQQILIRGQPEVDDLLSELRTLAQLDHPNIVRYFNGWLDYMNLGNSLDELSESVTGAEDTRTESFSRGRIIAEASEDHIMFENSVSLPLPLTHFAHFPSLNPRRNTLEFLVGPICVANESAILQKYYLNGSPDPSRAT